ncbi:ABC transporter ATP-binding protein [Alkalispirochaeta odontotermitis]|nr:ABC transporter ATP-binding protein [Alkalispirochaeta odontotermitis]CAB1082496.1 Glycine betaine ABC transport system, ATP-binding protein OpuAA (EC [Olavius algarvensis Delta 1 endosymbiont]
MATTALTASNAQTDAGPQANTPKIVCRDVWKVFGDKAARFLADHDSKPQYDELSKAGLIGAVRDVSLAIQPGEIFIIMGLSGSGKSTLVRCMSRLIVPTAGEIIFEGQDLLKMRAKDLIEIRRHKMGMVFQHFALLPHLTVLENVAFPLEVQGVDRSTRHNSVLEIIELVGLKGRENYYPRHLSGGQQQRVGIARSLAVKPEIWFLDEPFSALDPLIRREMQDEFLRLQNLLQKTIVFITHDFDEAIRLADRIAIMKDGAVIQIGTPEELVIKPANQHVAEFTREIPRPKVLSVRSVMAPVDDSVNCIGSVPADMKIEALAGRVFEQEEPLAVTDRQDKIIGRITRDAVLDVLINKGSSQ